MNRIAARHDPLNSGSGRVMQKAGMTYEGTMRQTFLRRDGAFGDLSIYSILKEEWKPAK